MILSGLALAGALTAPAWASWNWEQAHAFQELGTPRQRTRQLEAALADWPPDRAALARRLASERGLPDEIYDAKLVWKARDAMPERALYRDERAEEGSPGPPTMIK